MAHAFDDGYGDFGYRRVIFHHQHAVASGRRHDAASGRSFRGAPCAAAQCRDQTGLLPAGVHKGARDQDRHAASGHAGLHEEATIEVMWVP
jgi:hypothetical protein